MSFDEQMDGVTEAEDDASSTYLTFDLGEQILGVEVRHVREILDMQRITRLPNAPIEVLGVVDVRGASVPIVDLKARLGVASLELGDEARIVVIEIDAGSGRKPLGILADRVRNVDQIGADEIETVPATGIAHWDAGILQGLSRRGPDLIVLIDLERVFGTASAALDFAA
jgi:purine-binding chemotaxis protein CheW